MGLFTYVEFENNMLPEKYNSLNDWQTKDVVESDLHTLIIKENNRLYYKWNTIKVNENYDSSRPLWEEGNHMFEKDQEFLDDLNYHGVMHFYTTMKNNIWIDGYAKFTDGFMVDLKFEENKYQ